MNNRRCLRGALTTLLWLAIGCTSAHAQITQGEHLQCMNNLKQLAVASAIWATHHADAAPPDLLSMSNEIGILKALVCPADTRTASSEFRFLRNENLSYFIGLDAEETRPQMLLAGDRNLTNGVAPSGGILLLTPDRVAGWTQELHGGYGNLALADGSVQQVSSARLNDQLRNSQDPTNRIQLPELGSGTDESHPER